MFCFGERSESIVNGCYEGGHSVASYDDATTDEVTDTDATTDEHGDDDES